MPWAPRGSPISGQPYDCRLPRPAMMPGEGRFNIAAAMRDVVNFDGADSAHRYSRLWMLLLLAVIASAGVVGRWH